MNYVRCVAVLVIALISTAVSAQTVSGTVTDENNQPLPGATIVVQGTNTGTTSDFDGNYQIRARQGQTIVFSYVGYATQSVVVNSTTLDVSLQTDNALDEVVVTAYGTQTKESLTGSISEIKSDEFIKVASGNAITNLTGKVAGVQIFSNSGQPGTAPIIRFRGIGSLNGSSAPLYVVDGVPFYESITSINPNDIESISFLKDASAAALYGNRGANGVVIVTTKKGQKGPKGGFKVNIDLKTSYTSRAVEDYNVMKRADEYLEAYHKMLKTSDILANRTSHDDAGAAQSLYELISTRDSSYTLSSNTGNDLLEEIKTHRRIELWGEGFGLLDMKRWGVGLTRVFSGSTHPKDTASYFNIPAGDPRFTFQIPESEINLNDAIDQADQNK